jgi:hypothetical protein
MTMRGLFCDAATHDKRMCPSARSLSRETRDVNNGSHVATRAGVAFYTGGGAPRLPALPVSIGHCLCLPLLWPRESPFAVSAEL